MSFKLKLAKIAMNLLPSKPTYDITHPRSETVNHKHFINANEEEKTKILLEMAKSHYFEDQEKPFDHYFPGYSFKELLSGKKVLDLGCWCGGKTVSYAERWNANSMYGIDVNGYFIKAAILFSSRRENKNIKYDFRVGFGEALPYEDDTFDAIVSWDVLEHVQSMKKTIKECKRTLKPGGMLFSVFPSYYCPLEGDHLSFVTRMPCLNWFFDSKTLNIAYHEIMESRGEEAYWYNSKEKDEDDWRTLHGGIGINGTTFREFKSIVEEIGFSKTYILPTPLLSVGGMSIRHAKVKYISKVLKPFLKIESLEDYLSHRIVSILVV
jgi:ubiquinone/menaquinone biosynthesis C-methylase UbiE